MVTVRVRCGFLGGLCGTYCNGNAKRLSQVMLDLALDCEIRATGFNACSSSKCRLQSAMQEMQDNGRALDQIRPLH